MALERDIEGFSVGGNYRHGAHANQSLALAGRPGAHRPPSIKSLHAVEISANDNHGLPGRGSSYDISKRNGDAATAESAVDFLKGISGQGNTVFSYNHDV